MFDAATWPRPEPRAPRPRRRAIAAAGGIVTAAVTAALASLSNPPDIVINAPSHMRQIEITQDPFHDEIKIYLANAGFRDIHKHRLLAIIIGASRWRMTWQSDRAATIEFVPITAEVKPFPAPGMRLTFEVAPHP